MVSKAGYSKILVQQAWQAITNNPRLIGLAQRFEVRQAWWQMALSQHRGCRGKQISVSSSTA